MPNLPIANRLHPIWNLVQHIFDVLSTISVASAFALSSEVQLWFLLLYLS